jgi:DNA repair exonuclease SbcCD ATPase subunit
MPAAVARQIEYWLETYAPDADIKLSPLVLTREQVERYQLPRTPVKDSDRRKANFEERYGEGAVELDALEALRPGELASIVTENILQFRDDELEAKIAEARMKAEEELDAYWEARIKPFQEDLDNLKAQVEEVLQKYQARLEEMREELADELEPYDEEVESLWYDIQDAADEITPNLPGLPEPEIEEDDLAWLFDSHRDYFEQLETYKAWKGGQAKEDG